MTEETEVITKIAEIRRHPDFSRETFDNDLALVRLANHISFTPHIIPICLVEKAERKEFEDYYLSPKNGLRLGHVTGWGQLKENGPQPRFLQELRVPIVEDSKCRASTAFKVTSNMFCAGYGKEVLGDACKGDSGGPFVVPYKSRWIMLGVVSWGEGCGRNGKFGFYTKINNYLDWINAIIKL
jgi:secreted trypsin-like serine protease